MSEIQKGLDELEEQHRKLTADLAYMNGLNDLFDAVRYKVSREDLYIIHDARKELFEKLNNG